MKKKWIFIILLIVVSVVFTIYRYNKINEGVIDKIKIEEHSIGEVVSLRDLDITVNNIQVKDDIEGMDKKLKSTDSVYLMVDITIKNLSNKEIKKSLPNFILFSGIYNTQIDLYAFKYLNKENELVTSIIKPNSVNKGILVYSIPKEKYEKYINFNLAIPNEFYNEKGIIKAVNLKMNK